MTHHLFLTGPKHIGKSTAIAKLLAESSLRLGGFRTLRTDSVFSDRFSVHMLRPAEIPSKENLLFVCGEPTEDTMVRFDTLGCAALTHNENAQLLLMDEIGPHEAKALHFQRAVLSALDGDTPILGVLQQADSPFLQQIAAHEAVTVVEVTPENRNRLPALLRERFHF